MMNANPELVAEAQRGVARDNAAICLMDRDAGVLWMALSAAYPDRGDGRADRHDAPHLGKVVEDYFDRRAAKASKSRRVVPLRGEPVSLPSELN